MEAKNFEAISINRIRQLSKLMEKIGLKRNFLEVNQENSQNKFAILNEALTHTSAQVLVSHERLEFLGDAVLRLAASEFIDRNFPKMKVGDRSALRSQLVSDRWLSEVGKSLKIENFLIIGPKAAGDESAQLTLTAEATEALIGGIYECLNDLEPIHQWLAPYWKKESNRVLSDPHRENPKSALQEWSQSKQLSIPDYKSEEKNKKHGSENRFFCEVHLNERRIGTGWGRSRQQAEKSAARDALRNIEID